MLTRSTGLATLGLSALTTGAAQAKTFTVTNTDDLDAAEVPVEHSLLWAVDQSNGTDDGPDGSATTRRSGR